MTAGEPGVPLREGDVVWSPAADARDQSHVGPFMTWLEGRTGQRLPTYEALHRWSTEDVDGFWTAIWDYFDVGPEDQSTPVRVGRGIDDTHWFPSARINYVDRILARRGSGPAVIAVSQTRPRIEVSWDELHDAVGRAQAGLVRLGVEAGDRVVGYIPNGPEAVICYLATAGLGAVWSSCPPEFGARAVLDRFTQIEPKVLVTVDGYRFGEKVVERHAEVGAIRGGLPSLQATVLIAQLESDPAPEPDVVGWEAFVAEPRPPVATPLPFEHPMVIVYSSGTTGLPKPIVHGHGGLVLEHIKALHLAEGLGEGDRLFWYSTTGWIMWNILVSGLLVGASIVLFDGDLATPDLTTLWVLAEEERITNFGVGAGFLMACRRAGLTPGRDLDLSALRVVGSTGSPLPVAGFAWVRDAVGPHVQLVSSSGGTDVATGFVGGSPLVPVYAGEISCALLGCDVAAFDTDGEPVVGEQGELVLRRPMPSMPIAFWGDEDGSRRRAAYFDAIPGVWRHGDWVTITEKGTCVISGRSDATLNRGGVRLGTGEMYAVIEDRSEILDSLVVHVEDPDDAAGRLLLFVVLEDGRQLDEDLERQITTSLRRELSPRHVPDRTIQVVAIPRTLTGKKLEVPVKRVLQGEPAAGLVSAGALADPSAFEAFERLALTFADD